MKPFLVLGVAVVMGINADPGIAEARSKALAQCIISCDEMAE